MYRFLTLLLTATPIWASLVGDVRMKLSAGDLLSADALVEDFYHAKGATPEYVAGMSWLARGAVMLRNPDAAGRYLVKTKSLLRDSSKTAPIEANPFLTSAQGAVIEAEAQLLAAQGKRDSAIALLEGELPRWKVWPIRARIQKNLNLLTLEGKPAPMLDSGLRGKTVLLFLWAHWCGDCKTEAPVIARIQKTYQSRGLVVLAPTRRYGAVGDNDHATPEEEDKAIAAIWKEHYGELGETSHPVSEELMQRYGVSSTPTLVLVDRTGTIRMYRPYRMSEAELGRRIEALLAEGPGR